MEASLLGFLNISANKERFDTMSGLCVSRFTDVYLTLHQPRWGAFS